ncbi:MAG: tetratricopeptide repeat protein [Dehalococcoidia bacterium]
MIREFGVEQLAACGEETDARWTHAAYFLAFAERIKPELRGPEPGVWLDRLEADHDNLRAALRWSLDHESGSAETALRLCTALYLFWKQRGHIPEARRWLEMALERSGDAISLPRANGFLLLGHSTWDQSEAWRHYEQCLDLYRQLGHKRHTAGALTSLGAVAASTGEYERARALHEESRAIFDELGDEADIAQTEYQLGRVASAQGDFSRAKEQLDLARGRWERQGDIGNVAYTLLELGRLHGLQGQMVEAENLLTWSLQKSRLARAEDTEAAVLHELGLVALRGNNPFQAAYHFRETLHHFRELGTRHVVTAAAVEGMASVAQAQGQEKLAVRLWGAASAWRDRTSSLSTPIEREARERRCREAAKAMGTSAYDAEWTIGQAMTLDEAIALASSVEVIAAKHEPRSTIRPASVDHGLTARELDVLCRTVQGLTDQQIADTLFISRRTATTHAVNIRNKLDVDNRAAAAAFAVRHNVCDARSPTP